MLRIYEFLTEKSITKMDQPPYSPDIAPCDFWLFPRFKSALKGKRFAGIVSKGEYFEDDSIRYCTVKHVLLLHDNSGN
jgi:hypothetical protein